MFLDIGFDPAKRAATPDDRALDLADAGLVIMGRAITTHRLGVREQRLLLVHDFEAASRLKIALAPTLA